jgi:cellulose synthase/poly-beta-1,6-N-acetylglucosamine synthase-like glycosyltransferase
MLYAWEDPHYAKEHSAPKKIDPPYNSFSLLLPARHEKGVIEQTIKSLTRLNYPKNLTEIIVLIRSDDHETLASAQQAYLKHPHPNLRIITFNDYPINKPHSLNIGLRQAKGNIVAIFDAEDEPHHEILNTVNTILIREKVDVVQSGVQLMNYNSHWFSLLNVLEYFFWFKSGLHFFTKYAKVTPLGGNTIFINKQRLFDIGGWDEACLTEDADIGTRLVARGAKVRVVYDEEQVTKEETPTNTYSFVKQRTRWNQGFLQIFDKGDWVALPSVKQKLTMSYILLSPEIQALLLMYAPLGVWIALTQKLPPGIALLSFLPFYLLLMQIMIHILGIYEFARAYKKPFPIVQPLILILTYIPYNILLTFSSARAIYRILTGENQWEKTLHTNAHRSQVVTLNQYATEA